MNEEQAKFRRSQAELRFPNKLWASAIGDTLT